MPIHPPGFCVVLFDVYYYRSDVKQKHTKMKQIMNGIVSFCDRCEFYVFSLEIDVTRKKQLKSVFKLNIVNRKEELQNSHANISKKCSFFQRLLTSSVQNQGERLFERWEKNVNDNNHVDICKGSEEEKIKKNNAKNPILCEFFGCANLQIMRFQCVSTSVSESDCACFPLFRKC